MEKRGLPEINTKDIPDMPKKKSNMIEVFRSMASTLIERSKLASRMGLSYGNKRDIYKALGYTKDLQFDDYYARWQRQDIAKTVVEAKANACWRLKPEIREVDSDPSNPTKFEKDWNDLVRKHKIWHYMARTDRISGIGQYGVLLLGFNDGRELSEEVGKGELLYLMPYNESNAVIKKWESDATSERYGKPVTYQLNMKEYNQETSKTKPLMVHYSRILHVAEGLTGDDIFGTPRMQPVFNRLQDLELVCGGSGEMFWRGAYPGHSLEQDADATMDAQDKTDLEDEMQDYMNDLRRYVRLKGMKMNTLTSQVADPTAHAMIQLKLISAATRIPMRILIGSERGELASGQDENAWNNRVDERRKDFVDPMMLRPFIDIMIQTDNLSKPKDEYVTNWPPLSEPTEKEAADVSKIKTEAIAKYAGTPGADVLFPPEYFLTMIMNVPDEDVKTIMEDMEARMAEEEDDELVRQAEEEERLRKEKEGLEEEE